MVQDSMGNGDQRSKWGHTIVSSKRKGGEREKQKLGVVQGDETKKHTK